MMNLIKLYNAAIWEFEQEDFVFTMSSEHSKAVQIIMGKMNGIQKSFSNISIQV